MKTIGIDGNRYRDLTPCEIRMAPLPELDKPAEIKVCNASAPPAPSGYRWMHLTVPARFNK